jgi:hypothetical protein
MEKPRHALAHILLLPEQLQFNPLPKAVPLGTAHYRVARHGRAHPPAVGHGITEMRILLMPAK